ncbi:MAG: hypothetical protein WD825_05850 [Gemmatimonadaceae bacterium]
MKLVGRFVVAELVWATGIAVLMVAVAVLSSDPLSAADFVRWLARALGLAAFPAGIAIAPAVFDGSRPWRQLLHAVVAATTVCVVVFALLGAVAPAVSEHGRSLPRLIQEMSAATENWESRNDAAWVFYTTLFAPLNALLFAAIGIQVGIWSRYSLPQPLRRALYWAVGLGLLVSGFAVWDTTYETIVLHTAADTSFAAFYTVLIPASVCAALALPTLALARRVELPRSTS